MQWPVAILLLYWLRPVSPVEIYLKVLHPPCLQNGAIARYCSNLNLLRGFASRYCNHHVSHIEIYLKVRHPLCLPNGDLSQGITQPYISCGDPFRMYCIDPAFRMKSSLKILLNPLSLVSLWRLASRHCTCLVSQMESISRYPPPLSPGKPV